METLGDLSTEESEECLEDQTLQGITIALRIDVWEWCMLGSGRRAMGIRAKLFNDARLG